MTADFDSLTKLVRGVRLLAEATAPADVFRRLLEAGRSMAPRVSILLVRKGEIQGWTSSGYDPESAESQKRFRSPLDRGWLGRVAACDRDLLEKDPAEDDGPSPGWPDAARTVGGALRVESQPMALVVFERDDGEEPWFPEGLAMVTAVARLRLELVLARRRSTSASPRVASNVSEGPRVEKPNHDAREPAEARPVAAEPPETESVPTTVELEVAQTDSSESPQIEAARRYARLVATDIRLYNEEAVVLGRRNGDLAERLAEHLGRGEETFLRRHGALGDQGLEILHDAYVQVLAGGDNALIPSGNPAE